MIPEPSLNDYKIYYFSFIEHVENKYTRIYYLKSMCFEINTCSTYCLSCYESHDTCTDCDGQEYAKLIDSEDECYPPSYEVKYYIYDNESNLFVNCYESCRYCTKSNDSSSDDNHNCVRCSSGYLYSYVFPGNCYKYPNLGITDEKEVSGRIFISAKCSNYKIASTGECVDQCPSISPYYTYEYNLDTEIYYKIDYNPPKYSFNKICYEECPNNTEPDENYKCNCKYAFYKDSNETNIICLTDEDCPSGYPYQNNATKECFSSLDKCVHFFRDDCYSECPDGKADLYSQTEEVKNYIKIILSLNDSFVDKMCICDISNRVWSNNNIEKDYYQECLSSCPEGYTPESITNHCVLNNAFPSTEIIQTNLSIEKDIDISSYISTQTSNNIIITSIENNNNINP